MISINEVALDKVNYYGIISGKWVDSKEQILNMSNITEKPSVAYAEEHLGVMSDFGKTKKYFNVFGQYILTPEIFAQLKENIDNNLVSKHGEIELTTALEQVREKTGMMGIRIDGEMFDIGIPQGFRNTISQFRH